MTVRTLFWQKARSWSCCCWRDGCPVLPNVFFAFQPHIMNCTEVQRLNLKWIILKGQFHSIYLYGIWRSRKSQLLMILRKEGSIPEWKSSSVNSPRDYARWHMNFRLQSQHAKMPDLGCPQSLTRTTFKAHAHFSSQHLLIKLSVPHEYGLSWAFSSYKSRCSCISLNVLLYVQHKEGELVQKQSWTAKFLWYFFRKRPAKKKSFDHEVTIRYPGTVNCD